MLPKKAILELPAVAPKRRRKTSEKPTVKIAPMGLSQKDSCSYQTCRPTNFTSLIPRKEPVMGGAVGVRALMGG